jgi:hypothetical protein
VLELRLDGIQVPVSSWHIERSEAGHYRVDLEFPRLASGEHRLLFESPTLVPAEVFAGVSDHRVVGVQLIGAVLSFGGISGSSVDLPNVPPLPVTPGERWSRSAFGWFYDPAVAHLMDLWPWYVSRSGLPAWLALFGVVPLVWMLGAGLMLLRAYRRSDPGTRASQFARWLIVNGSLISALLVLTAVAGGMLTEADRRLPAAAIPTGDLPGCQDRCAMVEQAYRDVLQREPDVYAWLAYYTSDLGAQQLREVLCQSDEGQRNRCVVANLSKSTK